MGKNYTKFIFSILIIIPFFLPISGCSSAPGGGKVLASVGKDNITAGGFNERISNLPERYQKVVKRRKKDFLDRLINDTLLYQEALRKGLHKDKEVKKVIEEAKKKILIARLLKEEVDDKIDITDEDIAAFYSENSSEYMTPEIMRVSHILVQSPEEAEAILKKLEAGEDFEKLAKAKSVDPTAQRGGDIGYFPRGQLMPEFEEACVALEVGQTSGVVRTKLGYHIIKLTDRRPPEQKPLDQVRENIRFGIRAKKRQAFFNDMIKRLQDETEVEINEEVLSGLEEGSSSGEK